MNYSTFAIAPPIPYRADSAIDGMHAAGILLVTVLLLAATLMLLTYARRKGWLDKWRIGGQADNRSRCNAWTVDSQRISRQTTVHRLTSGDERWVVVESTVHVALADMQMERAKQENSHGTD